MKAQELDGHGLGWHQQMANLEAKRQLAEFEAQWAKVASNPYVNNKSSARQAQYKAPTMHEDWTHEWTEVSRDKVIALLRSGVVVKAVDTDDEPHLGSEMPTVNAPRGLSFDGMSDFTVGVMLDTRWKDYRFVVRTE